MALNQHRADLLKPGEARLELSASTPGLPSDTGPNREVAHAQPAPVPITQASVILTPAEVYEMLIHSASLRYNCNLPRLILLGMQAGMYVSLGVSTCAIAGGSLSLETRTKEPGLFNLIYAVFGFPLGLTLIVFTGTDLFTSACMYSIVGTLEGKFGLFGAIRTLVVPYFSNLMGALLLVGLHTGSEIFHGKFAQDFIIAVAKKKCHLGWGVVLVRGIMCNFLVCLAIWLANSARDFTGKFVGIWLPITAFVALGYEHCIANMFTVPMAMVLGADITAAEFIRKNLIPATIGNIVGGMTLVGGMYSLIYGTPGAAMSAAWDGMVRKLAKLVHGRRSRGSPHPRV